MNYDFFLPIVTYPDPNPETGLVQALSMVATIGGRLSVRIAEIDIPPIRNLLAETLIDISAIVAEAEQRSRDVGDKLADKLMGIAQEIPLAITIERRRCQPTTLVDSMVSAARTHDAALVVLDPDGTGHLALAEAILFGSGGPMLLCPIGEASGHLDKVAVAWDDSRAAARAVRDALPILRAAEVVSLLIITDDKVIDPESQSGIIEFLAFHGVKAKVVAESRGDLAVGEALQNAALRAEAGLLVMGAFGHSRFREFFLGGATASALRRSRLPILMSH